MPFNDNIWRTTDELRFIRGLGTWAPESYGCKAAGYCCAECGKKQSRAQGRECGLEVHHRSGITNWAEIERAIRRYLLTSPDELVPLCKACHQAKHNEVNHGS